MPIDLRSAGSAKPVHMSAIYIPRQNLSLLKQDAENATGTALADVQ